MKINVGMRVKVSDLDDIKDTHIILYDAMRIDNTGETEGTIGFIGTELNSESDKLFKPGASICPVYNSSEDYEIIG